MLTKGKIKINNSEWKLNNIIDVNGQPLLYNNIENGYYAIIKDDMIQIYEVIPETSKPITINLIIESKTWEEC